MKKGGPVPMIRTSVTILPAIYDLLKKENIKLYDAVEKGLKFVLAERGLYSYDEGWEIVHAYSELKKKAAGYAQKAADVQNDN